MDDNKKIKDFEEDGKLKVEELIRKYNTYTYSILKNSITNEEDIQELLSDVFFIIWKNYNSLDKNLKIKPYLIGIIKNLIKKKYQSYKINNKIDNLEKVENQVIDDIDIPKIIDNNDKVKIISEIISNIKNEEKEIFIMFYYQNKKIKDISKKLNISNVKVKVTLHRVRKLIKKKLKERGYSYGK